MGWTVLRTARKPGRGTLVIVVLMPPEQLLQDAPQILTGTGLSCSHTNLRINGMLGELMVYPYYGEVSCHEEAEIDTQVPSWR